MNYLQSIPLWLNALPLKKKLGLLLSLSLILMLTITLCWWVVSPSYSVLFTQLDEQDANQIITQLEHSDISYQLRHEGRDILIDKNLIAKTRLKLMGSGMQLNGSVGFELFDKSDLGMTDFSQKINYQRALQGELERTIASLDEVRQARVHLVIPERRLFAEDNNEPSAAITLQLKQPLSSKQVQSIQQLASASVAHLKAAQVVVVDQNGNTLSAFEEEESLGHLSAKKTIERYLNTKVSQMLYKIFKREEVLVKVDALINYDELQRELVKPQTQGLVTHEKQIKHARLDKNAKDKTQQDITLEKSYEFGREKELFKRAGGTIERLSVSVVVPKDTSSQTIDQIKHLVQSSIGFNEKRGDVISVEALISKSKAPEIQPFNAPPPEKSAQTMQWSVPLLMLAAFLCLSSASALVIRKKQLQRRKTLLIELTQWLHEHED